MITYDNRIDAFELTTFLSGSLIGRFFDLKLAMITKKKFGSESFEKVELFTSTKDPAEIAKTVVGVFNILGAKKVEKCEIEGYKLIGTYTKGKESLVISFEMLEIKKDLHILKFARESV